MTLIICKNCGKQAVNQSRGLCITCYKKVLWKPKKKLCKRCKREIVLHAKGYCPGCYNFIFHLESNRGLTYAKYHKISPELYKKLLTKCVICGFDKVVELHHLDENNKNNSKSNLICLCPNHHMMIGDYRYRKEMMDLLRQKGFNVPEDKKIDFKMN